MNHRIKRFITLAIALALLLSIMPQIDVMARNIVSPNPVTPVPYSKADVENLYTGVYNFNPDWLFFKPEVRVGGPLPVVKEQFKDAQGKYFYEVGYDDSSWERVSVPHAFNADHMYQTKASRMGDRGIYAGYVFYRKHFELPTEAAGKKVFIEFEGIKHASYIYLNGEIVGYYEAGVTAFGFDLSATGNLNYTGPNVIAVAADNRIGVSGRTDGEDSLINDPPGFNNTIRETLPTSPPGSQDGANSSQWFSNDFNPSQGGITQNVNLYIKGDVFQTLPLYRNLRTQGVYIYPSNVNVGAKTATINIQSEVRNETGVSRLTAMDVVLIDRDGNVAYTRSFNALPIAPASDVTQNADIQITAVSADDGSLTHTGVAHGQERIDLTSSAFRDTTTLSVSFNVASLNLWSTHDPYLYDVYTILKNGDDIIDVVKTTTGFRKVEFRTGANGGVFINDEFVWLTGYAQRSTNEWAAIGVANDWLTDYEMQLVRDSNANFIRWMHIAPVPRLIRSGDKYGVVSTVPAADKEHADVSSRMWNQRMEIMRDVVIYFRNSPSTLFWEIGNNDPSDQTRLTKMMEIKHTLDPNGMRVMGCRSIRTEASARLVEYVGTMLGRQIYWNGAFQNGGQGLAIRNMSLIQETEYTRDEAPKRVWDNWSPPHFQYRNHFSGVNGETPDVAGRSPDFDAWDQTAEDFVRGNVSNYNEYYSRRMQANASAPVYSAIAALCWSDSNQHGRQTATETGRMSGRVDALRLPKQSYYTYQTMQSSTPSVYLVGHWNYPTSTEEMVFENRQSGNSHTNRPRWLGTYSTRPATKTIYVVASNVASVELFVNGASAGVRTRSQASENFLYSWANINILTRGSIEAVGYNSLGLEVARMTIETVDTPTALRLTPRTGPNGLTADGADLAFIDVEVVDSQGRVHPLNYDKISFELIRGDAKIMGGYNGGLNHFENLDPTRTMQFSQNYRWEEGYNKSHFYAENGVNRLFLKAGRTASEIEVKFTLHLKGSDTPIVGTTTIRSEAIPMTTSGVSSVMPQQIWPGEFKVEGPPTLPHMRPVTDVFPLSISSDMVEYYKEAITDARLTTLIDGVPVDLGLDDTWEQLTALDYGLGVFAPAISIMDFLTASGLMYSFDRASPEEILVVRGDRQVRMVFNDSTIYYRIGNGEWDGQGPINNMPGFINGVFFVDPGDFLGHLGYGYSYDLTARTLSITTNP